jgi:heterodisulfide reductase subunit B
MKFALFLGCKIPYFLEHYETSSRAVLNALDVELTDVEFNCCGYPVRNLDFQSFVFSSTKNLALAERQGLNILTPCKCCYGNLRKADYLLKNSDSLRQEINTLLGEEGLTYQGGCEVKHLLSTVYHDVGVKAVQEKVSKPFKGLKIATHYGCHALRPSKITQFDDPVAPTIFDRLVEVTGAQSVDWSAKLDCCGNPLWEKNNDLSLDLTKKKLASGKQAGADYLCVACTYCQIQFDAVQEAMISGQNGDLRLPSILYPQLLGLSMGMAPEALGIDSNKLDISGVTKFMA